MSPVDAHVLVVEDNDLVGRAFQFLIESHADVSLVQSAAEARRMLDEPNGDFTALVLDIRLPDGSGLDVLAHARAKGYEGPALIYSGNHEPSELNRAFALRAEYLVKPAPAEALVSFVKRAVDRRTMRVWIESWATRHQLTPAERAIFVAAAEGRTRSEIEAEHPTTAKKHVHNLLEKTGDDSLLAAVTRALRERTS
jgi:two-component system response regulator DevR